MTYDGTGDRGDSASATVRFDLMDGAERRHGNDPYQAERRWFLEETEELRGRLEAEHRQQQEASNSRGLRGRMERLWGSEERSPSARRAARCR